MEDQRDISSSHLVPSTVAPRGLRRHHALISVVLLMLAWGSDSEAQPAHAFRAESRDQAEQWQQETRAYLWQLLKIDGVRQTHRPDSMKAGTLPLNPALFFENHRHPSYRSRDVMFTSTPKRQVMGVVTIPTGKGPFPAVVCIHGHAGSRDSVHSRASAYEGFAQTLATHGFVTIAIDLVHPDPETTSIPLAGIRLWDLTRAVDLLMSIPEVDPKRIGCAGLSLGGEMAMWLAAMDRRIQAALVAGWTPTIEHLNRNEHCPCWQVDGLEDAIDFPDIFGLIAPRPLMIQQGENDREFPAALGRATYERAAEIYGALGHRSRIELAMHPYAHQVMPDVALAFFQRTLGGHVAIPTSPNAKPAQQDAAVTDANPPFWVTGALGMTAIAALAYALWLRRKQAAAT